MKPALKFLVMVVAAFLGGCATAPVATEPNGKAASAMAPTAGPATAGSPASAAPAADAPPVAPRVASVAATPPSDLSKAAAETVEHLTQTVGGDVLPHELADTSSFPQAVVSLQLDGPSPKFEFIDDRLLPPAQGLTADGNTTALVVRDWTGLVLVPISTSLSKAHTSSVRLLKVEAHPLRDGRVRIWVRVQNVGRQELASDIACSFRMQGPSGFPSPNFYALQVPAKSFRDVFFVSPDGQLTSYTVLVRPTRE